MFDDPLIGVQLGSYELKRMLGKGGNAFVYLGEHKYIKNRRAAIKVLKSIDFSAEERATFLREAQLIANLDHANIVRILYFGIEVGPVGNGLYNIPYIVMTWAREGSLRDRYPEGTRLLLDDIVSYIKQMASALQYAHDQPRERIVHCDVKPENMLYFGPNEIRLSDFGIAVINNKSAEFVIFDEGGKNQAKVFGTVGYMAPERFYGYIRRSSDQYSLAIVTYEWLTGRRPFLGTDNSVMVAQVKDPPPPLRTFNPDISEMVEAVVLRALSKESQDRFPDVQSFADALEAAAQGKSRTEIDSQRVPVADEKDNETAIGWAEPVIGQQDESEEPAPLETEPAPDVIKTVDQQQEDDDQTPEVGAPLSPEGEKIPPAQAEALPPGDATPPEQAEAPSSNDESLPELAAGSSSEGTQPPKQPVAQDEEEEGDAQPDLAASVRSPDRVSPLPRGNAASPANQQRPNRVSPRPHENAALSADRQRPNRVPPPPRPERLRPNRSNAQRQGTPASPQQSNAGSQGRRQQPDPGLAQQQAGQQQNDPAGAQQQANNQQGYQGNSRQRTGATGGGHRARQQNSGFYKAQTDAIEPLGIGGGGATRRQQGEFSRMWDFTPDFLKPFIRTHAQFGEMPEYIWFRWFNYLFIILCAGLLTAGIQPLWFITSLAWIPMLYFFRWFVRLVEPVMAHIAGTIVALYYGGCWFVFLSWLYPMPHFAWMPPPEYFSSLVIVISVYLNSFYYVRKRLDR